MLRMFENKSDARTHRTQKALRAKLLRGLLGFAKAFGVRTRPRVAFVGIKMFLRCRDLSKLNGMALARSSSSIVECDCRKIQVIGGVLSETFPRIN
jgi:hypothetical protein